MPFPSASRGFLTAALFHLAGVGVGVLLDSSSGGLPARWDLWLWLLILGFVGCTTAGFALHLFPTISRRPPPPPWIGLLAFLLMESGLLTGAAFLFGGTASGSMGWGFSLGAAGYTGGEITLVGLFVRELSQPRFETAGPKVRPGDSVTIPLFLAAWLSAIGSGTLFLFAGLANGPGFGWWIAAIHLCVLGHGVVLITAVSLRLVPRSLDADVPRPMAIGLAALGSIGAVSVPSGLLLVTPSAAADLTLFAAPEAAFGLLFVSVLIVLVLRAAQPRAEAGLHLTALSLLLLGGGLGLWMVSRSVYFLVATHAFVNLLGFLGLTILFMWFGLIAPFQKISHTWTRRMLWSLSAIWLLGVGVVVASGTGVGLGTSGALRLTGAIVLVVAVLWAVGTIPVLFAGSNPRPGKRPTIRSLRARWKER